MANDDNLEELVASAEEGVAKAQMKLLKLTREWALEEAVGVEKFLIEEARLTVVVNQSAVTARVTDKIPAAKERVAKIAAKARTAVETWAEALSVDDATQEQSDLIDNFRGVVKPAVEEFGKLFQELGYDNGDTKYGYEWHFYNPGTGTARTKYVPVAYSAELADARSAYASVRSRANDLRKQLQTRQAAELWSD